MGYVRGSRAASRMRTQSGGGRVQGVGSWGAAETSGVSEELMGPRNWAHLVEEPHHPITRTAKGRVRRRV